MSINFPSNPANNDIYIADNGTNWIFSNVKNVWSVISQTVYNINTVVANNWVNPDSGNTFGCLQITGAKKIETPPYTNIVHNTISMGVQTIGYNVAGDFYNNVLTIPRSLDANTDILLCNLVNNSIIGTYAFANIYINGTAYSSDLSLNEVANAEYYIVQIYVPDDPEVPEIILDETSTINISFDYRPPVAWFDPEELGIINFKGAQLKYHAYVDGANGFNTIGSVNYVIPRYDSEYKHSSLSEIFQVWSHTGSTGDLSDYNAYLQSLGFQEFPYNDNKIYMIHYDHPNYQFCGNLYIQYAGTVWTGLDK